MPQTLPFTAAAAAAAAVTTPRFPFTPSPHHHRHHLPPRRLRLIKPPLHIPSPSPPPPPPPPPPLPTPPHRQLRGRDGANFEEKALYLDSLGLDTTYLLSHDPTSLLASSVSLSDIRSLKDFLSSFGFSLPELRRIIRMCPSILALRPDDLYPVLAFLVDEVNVDRRDLKRVINGRPTLLTCSVKDRLRPAFYFLKGIGVQDLERHTGLLNCRVEERFVPKLKYFEKVGLERRDVVMMFRRFPSLFLYGIETNYEPKMRYFVVEMRRELRELKVFPQYFSHSLQRRIMPRHKRCAELGVCLPLEEMLRPNNWEFRGRLAALSGACEPSIGSPLWNAGITSSRFDDTESIHKFLEMKGL